MKEINCEFWLPVTGRAEGYPYEVSDYGRVRRSKKGSSTQVGYVLSPGVSRGREYVIFSKDGETSKYWVHALVADTFLGSPPGPVGSGSDEWQVNHKDGDPQNNNVGNIEWTTGFGNHAHASSYGFTGQTHYSDEVVKNVWFAFHREDESVKEIADRLEIPYDTIYDWVHSNRRKAVTEDLSI